MLATLLTVNSYLVLRIISFLCLGGRYILLLNTIKTFLMMHQMRLWNELKTVGHFELFNATQAKYSVICWGEIYVSRTEVARPFLSSMYNYNRSFFIWSRIIAILAMSKINSSFLGLIQFILIIDWPFRWACWNI